MLVAPRRSGKTSVLRSLERALADDHRPVYVDLERDFTPADVAARFWALASGERFRLAQEKAEEDWPGLLGEALSKLSSETRKPVLLLLDELAFFLQNLAEGRRDEARHRDAVLRFLDVLADACAHSGARLIVAGSLNVFDYLQEAVGIAPDEAPALLAALRPFPLPPLSLDAPRTEMRRVLLGTGLVPEQGGLDWLVENADLATPYAALQFLDHLSSRIRTEGRIALDRLGPVLEEFLARTEVFRDFDEQLRRKGRELPGALKAVRKILDDIAEAPEARGVLEEQVRTLFERQNPGHGDRLLSWFLETFPVQRQNGRLLFASRLFRHWWRRQLLGVEQNL